MFNVSCLLFSITKWGKKKKKKQKRCSGYAKFLKEGQKKKREREITRSLVAFNEKNRELAFRRFWNSVLWKKEESTKKKKKSFLFLFKELFKWRTHPLRRKHFETVGPLIWGFILFFNSHPDPSKIRYLFDHN